MTQKEVTDITIDILTFLHEVRAENTDVAEVANTATSMVIEMLKRYPKLRRCIWEYSQEHILDELNLDYGDQ